MNKKEVFNHYSKILDELISNFNFFKTYFQDPFFIDEEVNVEDYPDYDFPCDLKIATGATRCCVVDRDYPYVVKMNLSETENRSDACEDEVSFYQRQNIGIVSDTLLKLNILVFILKKFISMMQPTSITI